jgi:hypothetical protein
MDLAAMGRVWYIEAMARAAMHDGTGLLETIQYKMSADEINGKYTGPSSQSLSVKLLKPSDTKTIHATVNDITSKSGLKDGWITLRLPASNKATPCKFKIRN